MSLTINSSFYLLLVITAVSHITSVSALSCSNSSMQNSYLWRIETDPPIYLYGTMHVPYKKIWNDVPDNVKTAFSESEQVYVELRLTDEDTSQKLSECRNLPEGEMIRDILPHELYIRILKYLIRIRHLFPSWLNGAYTSVPTTDSNLIFNAFMYQWEKQRPVWLLMLLSALNRDNVNSYNIPSLDVFMDRGGEAMGKSVHAIESYKDQCRPFNRLNTTKVITALRVLLNELEPVTLEGNGPRSTVDNDIYSYHCGDFLTHVQNTPILPVPLSPNISESDAAILVDINTQLTNQIVYRRNRRITKVISGLLEKERNDTTFIAIGAGHLIGIKSVVHMLRKRNYQVTRIAHDEAIQGVPLPNDFTELGDPSSKLRIIEVPKSTATPPATAPPTLPTLPPHVVSQIISQAVNKSKASYKIDSFEVTPTVTSLLATPTQTPSQHQSKGNRFTKETVPSGAGIWLININILITSLLITVLAYFN